MYYTEKKLEDIIDRLDDEIDQCPEGEVKEQLKEDRETFFLMLVKVRVGIRCKEE